MISRAPFLLSLGFLVGFVISCAHSGLKIKVYRIDGKKEGLVRSQNNEFIAVKDADGYYAVSGSDFESLVTAYQTCLKAPAQ